MPLKGLLSVQFRGAYFERDRSHFSDAVHWHVPSGGTKGKGWHFLVYFPYFVRNFAAPVEEHVRVGYHEALFFTVLTCFFGQILAQLLMHYAFKSLQSPHTK